ncbi:MULTISPECIES: winged helix-turn-helix transcriptional regulator [Mycobacteriaceae]|uniref:Response regulator transcription factor n=3 Tax=Mycobacteriaceae TaxID=1762 RepID=A0ACC6MH49_MYCPF|nr:MULTISPECIES: response regulator transcription factor [Mycobacteriaceae]MBU8830189.1 response regulator transcription factor [Mycolicibacterium goodii]OKH72345.1 transcriptional regulator [Mycobacterium sp. SWH-M1]QVI29441.1 response regulator transcription factor [Mycolicibacterium neoaurum]GFM16426.1 response regulator receiver protein [Mycobacterium sp. PO1]MCV7418591.1 response regulator transcription factor [Mycolicibacterium litorale]
MAHAGKETATTIEPHPASGSVASPAIAAGRIRVLLVEPRRIYADMLAGTLRAEEFAVDVARSDAAALTAVRDDDPDVVVVCLGSSAHGAVVLDRVRQAAHCGVVALADTEMAPLISRVGVVPIGSRDILNTRIRQTLRHSHQRSEDGGAQRRHVDDLVIDVGVRRVYQRGNVISLTRTEFAILRVLSDDPGEPVTCRRLQEVLWGATQPGGRSALGVHIGNLRRKLGDAPSCPRYVRTVRGIGYCLAG